jgi:pyruvate,orthophosphate dikinase
VGMTEVSMKKMAKSTGNYTFSLTTYVRFLKSFGITVLSIDPAKYDQIEEDILGTWKETDFTRIPMMLLESIAAEYKKVTFKDNSDEPWEQLLKAIYFAMSSLATRVKRESSDVPSFWDSGILVQLTVNTNRAPNSGRGAIASVYLNCKFFLLMSEFFICF